MHTESQEAELAARGIGYFNPIGLSDEDMVEVYVNSDPVDLASTYEGFGMPIVEANAVGRPGVTGNVASMPDDAADAACLVDPYSVRSVRPGILRVNRDPEYRGQLIANGYRNR